MSRRRTCWTSGAGGGAAGSEGSQAVTGEAGSGLSFLLTRSAPFVLGTVHDGLRTRGGRGRLSRPRVARPEGLALQPPAPRVQGRRQRRSQERKERTRRERTLECNGTTDKTSVFESQGFRGGGSSVQARVSKEQPFTSLHSHSSGSSLRQSRAKRRQLAQEAWEQPGRAAAARRAAIDQAMESADLR